MRVDLSTLVSQLTTIYQKYIATVAIAIGFIVKLAISTENQNNNYHKFQVRIYNI